MATLSPHGCSWWLGWAIAFEVPVLATLDAFMVAVPFELLGSERASSSSTAGVSARSSATSTAAATSRWPHLDMPSHPKITGFHHVDRGGIPNNVFTGQLRRYRSHRHRVREMMKSPHPTSHLMRVHPCTLHVSSTELCCSCAASCPKLKLPLKKTRATSHVRRKRIFNSTYTHHTHTHAARVHSREWSNFRCYNE